MFRKPFFAAGQLWKFELLRFKSFYEKLISLGYKKAEDSLLSVIVRVSIVLKRTVVVDND